MGKATGEISVYLEGQYMSVNIPLMSWKDGLGNAPSKSSTNWSFFFFLVGEILPKIEIKY
jgi:hypothetical protein